MAPIKGSSIPLFADQSKSPVDTEVGFVVKERDGWFEELST